MFFLSSVLAFWKCSKLNMQSHLRSLHHHFPNINKSTIFSTPLTYSYSYFHQNYHITTQSILPFPQTQPSIIDKEVIRVQTILKLHVSKPSEKVQTILSKCGISLSQELVLNVLKRHHCDWKSAYTWYRFVSSGNISNGYLPNLDIYNELINIFGRNKQFDLVKEVFDEMLEREGLVSNETWEVVLHRYAAAHMVDEAIAWFWKRREMGLKVDLESFQTVLKWLCRHKNVEEAEDFFYKTRWRFKDDIKSWNIILSGWCVRDHVREAKRVWRDIMESKCKPDKYTFGSLINALSKKGRIDPALKVFRGMWDNGYNPDVAICNTILHGLCYKKRVPEALELMKTMKEKGCELSVVTYNTLIQHLCRVKRMDKVAEILEQMKQEGGECLPNERTYAFLLSVAKNSEVAYGILKEMERSGCKLTIDTYNLLLRLYAAWGFTDRLRATWDEMEKSGVGHDERSYAVVVHGFYYKGKIDDALLYYHEMTSKGIIPTPKTKSLVDDMNETLKQQKAQKHPKTKYLVNTRMNEKLKQKKPQKLSRKIR